MSRQQRGALARLIVQHSLSVQPGEHILLDITGDAGSFPTELAREIECAGAHPHFNFISLAHLRTFIKGCRPDQAARQAEIDKLRISRMDGYIGIRADENVYELSDIAGDGMEVYRKQYVQEVQSSVAGLDKWMLFKYPTKGLAQLSGMSYEAFETLCYTACTYPFRDLRKPMDILAELMAQTSKVRIVGPGTDLVFTKGGIGSFVCDGKYNMPDGEVFTAPDMYSAEGTIWFNVPSTYAGIPLEQIRLCFSGGRVVEASASRPDELRRILSTDEGASRLGEFGIGLNAVLSRPTGILNLDEKMSGSIHLALGQPYPMADNGNQSSIHMDMVLCQLEEYGGGELYFDDRLIRRDGRFIIPELLALNP